MYHRTSIATVSTATPAHTAARLSCRQVFGPLKPSACIESARCCIMFDQLTPDSLTIVASYLAVIELHICVTHHTASMIRSSLPRWDEDLYKTQAFLRRFGTSCHPLPWHVKTSPNNNRWMVFFYTSHLDVAVFLQLAAISWSWVKPMNQLSLHIPAINVRKMPQFSYMLNTDFERLKFVTTRLEISRFDYQLLHRLRSQQLRLSFTF